MLDINKSQMISRYAKTVYVLKIQAGTRFRLRNHSSHVLSLLHNFLKDYFKIILIL